MSMVGRVAVITGANSGIGFETARGLASCGASIVMVCRDRIRGEAARHEVAKVAEGPEPTLLIADLAEQAQVRKLASDLGSRLKKIDVLINNAGVAFRRRGTTVDGVERTLAVNHLAPFLLTNLVLDLIRAAPQGRVIAVTSSSHAATLNFENLQMQHEYSWFRAYALSKLGNVLFTKELARRLAETPVSANCLDPGPALSHFGRGAGGTLGLVARLVPVAAFLGIFASTTEGARTPIYLAASPDVAKVSGRCFRKCREVPPKPIAEDVDVARRFWEASGKLCSI